MGAERILLAQADGANELITAAHLPESLEDFAVVARFLLEAATSSACRRRTPRGSSTGC